MSTIRAIIDQLNSRSDVERREILRRISSLFLERTEDRADRETEIFGQVFVELLDRVPITDRIDFSDRFAVVSDVPPEVARHLAGDADAKVAGPMLERSAALPDDFLLDVAKRHGQEHLLAIARRERLGSDLTDVLVERGGAVVHEAVSANGGATFSDGSLEDLVRSAAGSNAIAASLFRRPDISAERLGRALQTVDEDARERLARLVAVSRSAASALLEGTLDEVAVRRRRECAETEAFVGLIRSGVRRLDGCVDDLVRDDRVEDVAHLLATFAELEEGHVVSVLRSSNDFGLALVCRSLEVGEATWVALDGMRRRVSGSKPGKPAEVVAAYRDVDKVSADRALRFHRLRFRLT